MRHGRIALFAMVCFAGIATAGEAQTPSAQTRQFAKLVTDRYAAISSGDSAALHVFLADKLYSVFAATGGSMDTKQLLTAVSHIREPRPHFTIDSLDARIFGKTATVSYRRIDKRVAGGFKGAFEEQHTSRSLDVLTKRGDRWLLVEHSETWIVNSPAAVTLDSVALNAFVGRYEAGPGFVDDVHWEGEHLVATATTEKQGATLVPVSQTAFSPNGIAPLIVFERDAKGRVLGYVQESPDGVVRRARRLP